MSERKEWICDNCQLGAHNFCDISSCRSNCKCPVCYSKNMELTKKTLQKKYKEITGVSPNE